MPSGIYTRSAMNMNPPKRDTGKTGFKELVVPDTETYPAAPGREELELLVKQFAPLLVFHAEEQYFPSSVEWYLQKTWLVNSVSRNRVPADLAQPPAGLEKGRVYYLEPKEGANLLRQEDRIAKTYVHAKAHGTYTDLQYWFFFAQTGSASAGVKWLIDEIKGHEGKIDLSPLGKCNGAWERITVRINNATHKADKIYFPQGGEGAWVLAEKVQKKGNQPLVYVSKNECSFYPEPGLKQAEKHKFNLFSSRLEFCFQAETMKGTEFDFSDSCELISANYLEEDKPEEPSWLNFYNNWGNPNPEYLTVSAIKRMVLSTFGKTLEFLLSRDILDELVKYLLSCFTDQSGFRSMAPKAKKCWEEEGERGPVL